MNLSKSKYCTGIQCPKILWMDKNMPEQKAEQDNSRMLIGNMVGDLAMGYFGEYTEVSFNHDNLSEMINETIRLLGAGTSIITEASFVFDGNFCSVDILRKTDDGYEISEVKSSTGDRNVVPLKINKSYLDDMAYQYYVLTHCGIKIKKVSLMQLNKEYIRRGELDIRELFVLTDCTDIVIEMQGEVPAHIVDIKTVATMENEPKSQINNSCIKNDCVYRSWCFRNFPENNIYDIGWSMRGSIKDQAYNCGYITFEEIFDSPTKLSEHQLLQVKTVVNNLSPHIEPYSIRQFLSGLTYPLYHLDFETYQQPIPLWNDVKPYQQIPFQYSLHIQDIACGETSHKEFLGKEGVDPRRAIAEKLCDDIPDGVCVLAYSAGFEKTQIRGLAELFPDMANHLMRIHDNIKDLAHPFAKGYYYCREMGGSYSIKHVLPALCSGDPELDYRNLDLIHNGGEAMNAFASLHEKSSEEIKHTRKALLAYCRLDTLAMVKILERLYEAVAAVD